MSASVEKRPCSVPGHSGPIRGSSLTRDDGSREALSKTSYFDLSTCLQQSSTEQYHHFSIPRLAVGVVGQYNFPHSGTTEGG
jgi:hypothetical protein